MAAYLVGVGDASDCQSGGEGALCLGHQLEGGAVVHGAEGGGAVVEGWVPGRGQRRVKGRVLVPRQNFPMVGAVKLSVVLGTGSYTDSIVLY